jgi:uncharacterized small protein (DUF1192 family)
MANQHTMHKAQAIHDVDVQGLKKLSFYEDEMNILEKRLHEITAMYTSDEIREQIASLREQLILKRTELKQLQHDFTAEEFMLADQLEKQTDEVNMQRARELHERMGYFQKEIKELWVVVNDFLSKTM